MSKGSISKSSFARSGTADLVDHGRPQSHGQARIAIEPADHPWAERLASAVIEGGGAVVDRDRANGLIWLNRAEADLRDFLTDQIEWVQLRAAGVEYWLTSGQVDESRVFTSARGVYGAPVAEHVVALLLIAARSLQRYVRASAWDRAGERRSLRGAFVGILGGGGIARELVRLLGPFEANCVVVNRTGVPVEGACRTVGFDDLPMVLDSLDYLVLAAPATAETIGIVDADFLETLPDHCWIVNVARGDLVVTEDLIAALRHGRIAGAALDVTDPEPLPEGHPLWEMPNVVITPHVANLPQWQLELLAERVRSNVGRFRLGVALEGTIDLRSGY